MLFFPNTWQDLYLWKMVVTPLSGEIVPEDSVCVQKCCEVFDASILERAEPLFGLSISNTRLDKALQVLLFRLATERQRYRADKHCKLITL